MPKRVAETAARCTELAKAKNNREGFVVENLIGK